MSKKIPYFLVFASSALVVLALLVYSVPQIYDRLGWHLDNLRAQIKYALNPPEDVVFLPEKTASDTGGAATQSLELTPQASATLLPTPTFFLQPEFTQTPIQSATPPPTELPLPPSVRLEGVRYEDQHGLFNYCAPANLSMALSFWKWKGDRVDVGTFVKPYGKDKNVMPYELADFVMEKTDLNVALRVGGDAILLKRFLTSGYPVLIERGAWLRDTTGVISWMGHYQVITGYDEAVGYFIAQDTFLKPNLEVPMDELVRNWRAFNFTYLVIYPHGKYNEVMNILGADADVDQNYQNAANKASNEIVTLEGVDKYFAWFNRGENLASLQDYGGASTAFDEAFTLYPSIPEDQRPWRIMWYRTGPYKAYFGVQRYWDVINLATTTLDNMSEPILEESYYWRARAEWEVGDQEKAIVDFKESLKYHPGFGPALYQAQLLGINL